MLTSASLNCWPPMATSAPCYVQWDAGIRSSPAVTVRTGQGHDSHTCSCPNRALVTRCHAPLGCRMVARAERRARSLSVMGALAQPVLDVGPPVSRRAANSGPAGSRTLGAPTRQGAPAHLELARKLRGGQHLAGFVLMRCHRTPSPWPGLYAAGIAWSALAPFVASANRLASSFVVLRHHLTSSVVGRTTAEGAVAVVPRPPVHGPPRPPEQRSAPAPGVSRPGAWPPPNRRR